MDTLAVPLSSTSTGRLMTLIHDADHGIGTIDGVLIQIRRGPMTLSLLDTIATFARMHRLRIQGPSVSLVMLEEGAPVPESAVRKRQGEVLHALLSDRTACMALVIPGDGLMASTRRTTARMTSPNHSTQVRQFEKLPPAADWVVSLTGIDPATLLTAVARLRQVPG